VAVVGIPHPDWGEAVVRTELAAYKRPKAYRVGEALPVTAFGKVDEKAPRGSWPGW
jgi:fatty-acyl-CoA synthase/long-chain acyl-CoA synthetase